MSSILTEAEANLVKHLIVNFESKAFFEPVDAFIVAEHSKWTNAENGSPERIEILQQFM